MVFSGVETVLARHLMTWRLQNDICYEQVLDKSIIQRQNMGAQVKREISIMKLVRHPYVVQLREVLASSSKIFLVCELITGGELFDKIVEKQVGNTGLVIPCHVRNPTAMVRFSCGREVQLPSFSTQASAVHCMTMHFGDTQLTSYSNKL